MSNCLKRFDRRVYGSALSAAGVFPAWTLPGSFLGLLLLAVPAPLAGQQRTGVADSLHIRDLEYGETPYKVLHAEPLYIDLIRDLGARKGEREWNIGLGLADNLEYDSYEALVEYEWAPVDRLGFSFFSALEGVPRDSVPSNQLDALQVALQWTFLVDVERATSMALGYLNEFELSNFDNFGNPLFKGNAYNPFLVVAKRWGTHFHSLIYTGPIIEQDFRHGEVALAYEMHTSFHYMVPGTDNFIGGEFNKTWEEGDFDMTIRPQMRLDIADEFLLGIVTGIPISRENQRFSAFLRLIYEPEETP